MATAFLPQSPFKVNLKLNSERLRRWRDRPKQILRMHSRMWENKRTCRRIFLRRWSWCWGRSWRARYSRWCGRTPFDRSLKDQEPHNDTLPRNELPKLFLSTSHTKHLLPCFAPQMALLGFFILPPYAATGNQTHIISVAPPWGTFIQDALPTELPQPQQVA